MEPLFVADSVGKAFRGKEVLKGATCWAVPGTVTVLFGRNGSGKSTLIKVALGLLSADFGVFRYDGLMFRRPKLHRLSRLGLMYLPDRGLFSRRRTLRWHHRLLSLQLGSGGDPAALEVMRVTPFLDRRADQVSGGEKRRAELSLALARRPRCLMADEPLAGIAPADQEEVSGALRTLADRGCAVLVTGHDVGPLLALADQVVWVVGGTTHWLGAPSAAKNHFQFQQEYLGPRGYSE